MWVLFYGVLKVIIIIVVIFGAGFIIGFLKNLISRNWEKDYCKDCCFFQTDECNGDGFNCWQKKKQLE